ncbi:MAG: hypothetical protein KGI89_15020 [Euryarchaeota archaeon]|nr:hypothetical protein [Euryarchaeota archaeon]
MSARVSTEHAEAPPEVIEAVNAVILSRRRRRVAEAEETTAKHELAVVLESTGFHIQSVTTTEGTVYKSVRQSVGKIDPAQLRALYPDLAKMSIYETVDAKGIRAIQDDKYGKWDTQLRTQAREALEKLQPVTHETEVLSVKDSKAPGEED